MLREDKMAMQACPEDHGYRCHYCKCLIRPGQLMEKRYTFYKANGLIVRMVEYAICEECAGK